MESNLTSRLAASRSGERKLFLRGSRLGIESYIKSEVKPMHNSVKSEVKFKASIRD